MTRTAAHRRARPQIRPPEAVPPLHIAVPRTVRFEEVDAARIMWHGRYASWLEDGREALGRHYGISYLDFLEHNIVVPLKLFQLDFLHPLRYSEQYIIHAFLHWNEAAVLDYTYRIENSRNELTTTAATTQLMLRRDGGLLLEQPEFYAAFRERWHKGMLS